MRRTLFFCAFLFATWANLSVGQTWNNPHGSTETANTFYSAFTGAPKTLDPAVAYSSDEIVFISQIYEPPLQYDLFQLPYTLIPLTASQMPVVTYYDRQWKELPPNAPVSTIAYTSFDIFIRPAILYQPHPAFAKNPAGRFLYHHLDKEQGSRVKNLSDFKVTATRELTAEDYVYGIKRLASPKITSPIFGLMSHYLLGFEEYARRLAQVEQEQKKSRTPDSFLDLRQYPLTGAQVISRYHYRITIKGVYPQFKYWLAMTFFSPIPWEADAFYSQPLLEQNTTINFNWYPVGTGPYYLAVNNPNKEIVLRRNVHFHPEFFPSNPLPDKIDNRYFIPAGKRLPLIDQIIFTLDKESIPRWNKFLQGYYDKSGISADSFDQAIKLDQKGRPLLTENLQDKGLHLETAVLPSVFYMGFNSLDEVVGTKNPRARKLRQALAIAVDFEEYISIFMNGRGIPAQGPIPPGIFGYQQGKAGLNPVVYFWNEKTQRVQRRPLSVAKRLLAEAGYPGGVDPKTGKPLILHYDVASSGNPEDQAIFNWMRKQFAKLGIRLDIRSTQYNRFRDKIQHGDAQIFSWGWSADYPDPENFLFLLYGPNGKVKYGGENATNYENPTVDRLFVEIRNLPDGPLRQQKINQLVSILQKDTPWIWGYHPILFTLSHSWNNPLKINPMSQNDLKYYSLNLKLRAKKQAAWNKPILWPLFIFFLFVVILFVPLAYSYQKREHRSPLKRY